MERLKVVLEHENKAFDKCFLRYCKTGLPVESPEGQVLIPLGKHHNWANQVRVRNVSGDSEEWWNGDTYVYLLKTEMNCSRIEKKP